MKATKWHSRLDLNQHRGSQSLLCYRYTTTAYTRYGA